MNFALIILIIILIALIVITVICLIKKDSFENKEHTNILNKFDAYYINLKRRPDKNKNTLVELDKSNILRKKMKRFEAIDGKEIDLNNYKETNINKKLLEKRRGWIGCALSHIKLWQRCVNIKKPILVFEDDNVIKKETDYDKNLETIINNFPNDYDIVYLITDNIVKYKHYNDLFVKAIKNNSILSAYFISPTGAQKLLDSIMPYKPDLQIDWYIDILTRKKKINCYIYKKSIMYTIQDFNNTDIQGKTNYVKKFEKNY